MKQSSPFKPFLQRLRATAATFPDNRKGKNTRYTLVDAALGAFAVFFTQSPSFLAHQRAMQARKGQSNAHTLFGEAIEPESASNPNVKIHGGLAAVR